MYFPVADVYMNPLIPLVVGLVVSVIGAPVGISGGFLIVPIYINFLGFTSLAVSPTNFLYNIVAVPLGIWRLHREKRLMWGLSGIILVGLLPGVFGGAIIRCTWMAGADNFKIFVAIVLSMLALGLLVNLLLGSGILTSKAEKVFYGSLLRTSDLNCRYSFWSVNYQFGGESFCIVTPKLIAFSLVAGVLGGVYGLGGAAIIGPVLIIFFRIPIYLVSGASLFAGWAGAFFGLLSYIIIWPFISGELPVWPDFKLGILFGFGGLAGIYLGSVWQRYLPPKPLKIVLLIIISIMALRNLGVW